MAIKIAPKNFKEGKLSNEQEAMFDIAHRLYFNLGWSMELIESRVYDPRREA